MGWGCSYRHCSTQNIFKGLCCWKSLLLLMYMLNLIIKLLNCFVFQDSVSDVLELMKKQEDLEAMIQAQSDRFNTLHNRKTWVKRTTSSKTWSVVLRYDLKFAGKMCRVIYFIHLQLPPYLDQSCCRFTCYPRNAGREVGIHPGGETHLLQSSIHAPHTHSHLQ